MPFDGLNLKKKTKVDGQYGQQDGKKGDDLHLGFYAVEFSYLSLIFLEKKTSETVVDFQKKKDVKEDERTDNTDKFEQFVDERVVIRLENIVG
jgi:hypothetical protein